jgi:CheY-like chemotaxis protein/DNA-directed RNA polymerase specialized sigma24 family protein
MSLSSLVAPQLPFLRRYARALSGNRASGDAYVTAMLEALVVDPSLFDRSVEPRIASYKMLSQIWNIMPLNAQYERIDTDSLSDHRLETITPMPRQTFLLTAVEGFSPEQAATILGLAPRTISSLIEHAGREIADQVSASVLIIEDEPIIAMDLGAVVEGLGHHVIGNPRTREDAVEAACRLRPGLIIADIRLSDGSSGLDAVKDILAAFEVPVIFVTAYPAALLTGEAPEPAFLIAKPFRDDTVRIVVSQALFLDAKAQRMSA